MEEKSIVQKILFLTMAVAQAKVNLLQLTLLQALDYLETWPVFTEDGNTGKANREIWIEKYESRRCGSRRCGSRDPDQEI